MIIEEQEKMEENSEGVIYLGCRTADQRLKEEFRVVNITIFKPVAFSLKPYWLNDYITLSGFRS